MQTDDTTVRVPLRAQNGSVRAYALIDAADADFVNQWTWRLNRGYAARYETVDGKFTAFKLHRVLLGLVPGDGLEGDHQNLDRLDNRRENLRIATRHQNMQNLPSYAGASSQYRGVTWHKGHQKWSARVRVNGKLSNLGHFRDETEAAEVARAARARLMPFANN